MQLLLWEETQELVHHFMELHYYGGKHRVIDTANPDDDDTLRDMNVYSAGFITAHEALKIMQHSVTSKETTRANAMREVERLGVGPAPTQVLTLPAPIVDNGAIETIA